MARGSPPGIAKRVALHGVFAASLRLAVWLWVFPYWPFKKDVRAFLTPFGVRGRGGPRRSSSRGGGAGPISGGAAGAHRASRRQHSDTHATRTRHADRATPHGTRQSRVGTCPCHRELSPPYRYPPRMASSPRLPPASPTKSVYRGAGAQPPTRTPYHAARQPSRGL